MEKKINFNAGPAELPGEVLYEIGRAIQKYKKTGISILELPHRGKEFAEIVAESNSLVKELCGIGDDYEIVWMHGGGRMQFCMIPMNFLGANEHAAYIDSGHWSKEAAEYAQYYGEVKILASSEKNGYNSLPAWPEKIIAKTAYLHITTNNTIEGTQWHNIPDTKVPLIADMSSDILSAKRDYTKYAMFYAAAQKNLGIAGVGFAAIRKDLLKKSKKTMPPLLSYQEQIKENSLVNTPNVLGIYTSLLMLRWIQQKGIDKIEQENQLKATTLYKAIDNSKIFKAHVADTTHRSLMNVCFSADTKENETKFLELCEKNNIVGIQGHRSKGGFRVSLYNAITAQSVDDFVAVMNQFEQKA